MPHAIRTLHYGPDEHQAGDLHLPDAARPPVVCLLHGGFWRMPYGREQMDAVARDLAARGNAVWNLGYRRVGAPGGGWPGTLTDVGAGIDHLATLAEEGTGLDLGRVAVVGHSAGGQLALWSASRASPRVHVASVAGLAPVADLARAHDLALGSSAVAAFLGGSPALQPERYRAASPSECLPLGARQLVVHGTADAAVPVALTRDYARAARAAGDDCRYVELEDAGHMDFLDPASEAHAVLVAWLADL